MRLVQTNLREIDADLDVDRTFAELKALAADVLLINVGGIVAHYPTDLPCHFRNPHLRGDLVGAVCRRARAEGVRVIARFDFSKVNAALAAEHADWLYVSPKGETIVYNGQAHVCINGPYQQTHALEILEEALDRYAFDGVFFNMIGYVESDYSGKHHGICQCRHCAERFAAVADGAPLPVRGDRDDPVYLQYLRFQEASTADLFGRIHRFVKDGHPETAIVTYTATGVDVVRQESNTGLDRPKPEWTYSATANTNAVLTGWPEKTVSNAAVHFIDFPYRHAAVSPHLTRLRLAENMANAAWLDYYVIGPLERQDDRTVLGDVGALFRYYADHEAWYTGVAPAAPVALIQPHGRHGGGDLRGLIQLLTETHVLFNLLPEAAVEGPESLQPYTLVILPDMHTLDTSMRDALEAYVAGGGKLLATGMTGMRDAQGRTRDGMGLACAGVPHARILTRQRGAYLRVRPADKAILEGFEDLDLLVLDGELVDCSRARTGGLLGYVPPPMFGPPEKCYIETETDIPGILHRDAGPGRVVIVPWALGRHYETMAHHGHRALFNAALVNLLDFRSNLRTNASPLVEFRAQCRRDGAWHLLSLVNHSGQNRSAFHAPLPLHGIEINYDTAADVRRVRALRAGVDLAWTRTAGGIVCTLPRLDLFETLVMEHTQ